MKLKIRPVVVAVFALTSMIAAAVVVQPTNIPSASAQATGQCGHVTVGFIRQQLPLGTYPAFTIQGPNGLTIPSSRFFPGTGGTFETVRTTSAGANLPPGNYRIDVEPMAGTSSHNLINGGTGHSATINCLSQTSILFLLGYAPAAPSGGPSLRINPAPQTVQAGGNPAFFGAEYSTDGQSWSDVSGYTTFSSPQEGTIIHNAGSPHGGTLQEILGRSPGVAQIVGLYAGLTASANLTVTAGAPGSPRPASCSIESVPNPATGGPVRLLYSVQHLPTTITITADDAAAIPPGTPTVGAPDPGRVDSQQDGSIDSGPVTKRTVFTMTVANSVATQRPMTCSVTVPFNERPTTGLQLPLIATLLDMPNEMVYPGPTVGTQGIRSVAYSNGNFAFSGECGGPKDQRYLGSGSFRQGGAWFFKDDGAFIAQRDLCMDGGSRFQSLFFHGKATSRMVADGDRGFFMSVKSMGGSTSGGMTIFGAGADRVGYYQIAGSGVIFTPQPSASGFSARVGSFVAAGGKAIGIVQTDEQDSHSNRDVTLSLPSFQILAEREENSMRPIIGFGDYILGRVGRETDRCTTILSPNGIPTVFRAESDGGLTSVQTLTLPDNLCPGARIAIDHTTSPKRLAITSFNNPSGIRSQPQYTNRIFLFTSGANGLEPAGELVVPATILADANRTGSAFPVVFAVGGSRLAFSGRATDGKFFTLWNGDELVGIAEPPTLREYRPGIYNGVAGQPYYLYITPQGKVMAATNQNAFLFGTSGGVTPPPPPDPSPTSTPSGQIPGQTFNVHYVATSTVPSVLIRMANVLSVGASSLNISIFGRTYSVDATGAQVVGSSWLPISLSTLVPGHFVNVWGTLDMANSAIIHAVRIRNPMPAGVSGQFGTSFTNPTSFPATVPTAAPSAAATAATQTQLNVLQQALRALQLRLAQ